MTAQQQKHVQANSRDPAGKSSTDPLLEEQKAMGSFDQVLNKSAMERDTNDFERKKQ